MPRARRWRPSAGRATPPLPPAAVPSPFGTRSTPSTRRTRSSGTASRSPRLLAPALHPTQSFASVSPRATSWRRWRASIRCSSASTPRKSRGRCFHCSGTRDGGRRKGPFPCPAIRRVCECSSTSGRKTAWPRGSTATSSAAAARTFLRRASPTLTPENADGPPSGAAREQQARRVRDGLFPVVDGHLQLLARAERRRDRCFDGDRLAGLGVPALARCALARFEIAEARDLHLRPLLELARDDPLVIEQGIDGSGRVGLGHLGPNGQR